MTTDEAIILAGGFGTRLQTVVSDVPKPMAQVAGRPFLEFLVKKLTNSGFKKIVLSVGYKADVVMAHFSRRSFGTEISFCVEDKPLGTGGGIKLAMSKTSGEHVVVLNGDSLFDAPLDKLFQFHLQNKAVATLALRRIDSCERYGRVVCDKSGRIEDFEPKGFTGEGLINGGIYILKRDVFEAMPESFSIEEDFFKPRVKEVLMFGLPFDSYFIDIGIPEDYQRAQKEFEKFKD